jgi:hypothetical protein
VDIRLIRTVPMQVEVRGQIADSLLRAALSGAEVPHYSMAEIVGRLCGQRRGLKGFFSAVW